MVNSTQEGMSSLTSLSISAASITAAVRGNRKGTKMSFDYAAAHDFVVQELNANREINQSMNRVIDHCDEQRPHSDWDTFRNLPFDNTENLQKWISMPFQLDPPAEPLGGLWFGLHNTIVDGKEVADMRICGARTFVADPYDNSWAVDSFWYPKHDTANSEVLRCIYQTAYRPGGLRNDAEYPLCLAYGGLATRDLLRTINAELVLGKSEKIGVAVGFDSGDFVLVGYVTREGLLPITGQML